MTVYLFIGYNFSSEIFYLYTAFFLIYFTWFITTKDSAFLIKSISSFSILGVLLCELFFLIYSILLMIALFWEFYWAIFIFYKLSMELLVIPKFFILYCCRSWSSLRAMGITAFLSSISSLISCKFPTYNCFSQNCLTSWKCWGTNFLLKTRKSSILHKLRRHCSTAFCT